jgi:hypothetical protein
MILVKSSSWLDVRELHDTDEYPTGKTFIHETWDAAGFERSNQSMWALGF